MDTENCLVSLYLLYTHTRLVSPSTRATPFALGLFHLPEIQEGPVTGSWNMTYSN